MFTDNNHFRFIYQTKNPPGNTSSAEDLNNEEKERLEAELEKIQADKAALLKELKASVKQPTNDKKKTNATLQTIITPNIITPNEEKQKVNATLQTIIIPDFRENVSGFGLSDEDKKTLDEMSAERRAEIIGSPLSTNKFTELSKEYLRVNYDAESGEPKDPETVLATFKEQIDAMSASRRLTLIKNIEDDAYFGVMRPNYKGAVGMYLLKNYNLETGEKNE